jgi:hypothetical protein
VTIITATYTRYTIQDLGTEELSQNWTIPKIEFEASEAPEAVTIHHPIMEIHPTMNAAKRLVFSEAII